MGDLVQTRNKLTGSQELVVLKENHDSLLEIARSKFADMLHDTERNQKYEAALKVAIDKMHGDGKKAVVLDIGTGSGLLAMMAARNGADKVFACEAVTAISNCAIQNIEFNGFMDKIKVIPKKSQCLTVGEEGDLEQKCNILVTEVFDTDLIGEWAISIFNHAHSFLLTEDCIVVPHSATIYAQVVEFPLSDKWSKMLGVYENDQLLLEVPPCIQSCMGSQCMHDIQLSQLPLHSFKQLTNPIVVNEFDWTGKVSLNSLIRKKAIAKCDGRAEAIFVWWDLKMDIEKKIILSCAPYWDHPISKNDVNMKIPWRDHWMQSVFFPNQKNFKEGEEIILIVNQDEYSLSFEIVESNEIVDPIVKKEHFCVCGFHRMSRNRIGQLNDGHRRQVFTNILKHQALNKNILVLGNAFYLSLIASKFNADNIYIYDENESDNCLSDFRRVNHISNVKIYNRITDFIGLIPRNSIHIVLAEPFFFSSTLPWDNLQFYFILKKCLSILDDDVKIYPKYAKIKAVAVQFDDLHKIRAPVRECEGFNMNIFDDLIREATISCDDEFDPQPLWEYPGIAMSFVEEIAAIDLSDFSLDVIETKGNFKIQSEQPCNGIAVWVEWWHGDTPEEVISTGAIEPPKVGERIKWDMHCKQGVALFENTITNYIPYDFKINFVRGEVKFNYKL